MGATSWHAEIMLLENSANCFVIPQDCNNPSILEL